MMRERIVRRYSLAFQRQVVEDLEAGRFGSAQEAREHYGIRGKSTIKLWLMRHGKNGLCAKVVRVEKLDEGSELLRLNGILKQEYGLGQTLCSKALAASSVKEAVMLYNHYRPHPCEVAGFVLSFEELPCGPHV